MRTVSSLLLLLIVLLAGLAPAGRTVAQQGQPAAPKPLRDPREVHLANIRQLTFEGENAEAYFSTDGKKLIFQRTSKADGCDQIFSMNLDGSDVRMLSNGQGKTTCAYFTPGGRDIVYATTALDNPVCPHKPDFSLAYVW